MIIFVDIDETICHSNPPDYEKSTPVFENINKINKLYIANNTIIYWTARGTVSGKNWFEITEKQLKKWKCKYHKLRIGKPSYDLIIDDKSKRIEEL